MINKTAGIAGFDIINLSNDDTVTSGNDNDQTLQPPQGFIYQVVGITYHAPDPVGSGAGTHQLEVYHADMGLATVYFDGFRVIGNTGSGVFIHKVGLQGDNDEKPANDNQQFPLLYQWLYASYDHPLTFKYTNDTDVSQTGTRGCYVAVLIHKEAM